MAGLSENLANDYGREIDGLFHGGIEFLGAGKATVLNKVDDYTEIVNRKIIFKQIST